MPSNDREVFDFILSDSGTSLEIDYLTYAIFAFNKREWMAQHETVNGNPPDQAAIDGWISNLTPYNFVGMRSEASNFFDAAAREYMADDLAAAVEAAKQSELVNVVKAASSFWKQLFIGFVTAVLTPFIIAGFIVLGVIFSSRFPSPTDIAKWFGYAPSIIKGEVPQVDRPKVETAPSNP